MEKKVTETKRETDRDEGRQAEMEKDREVGGGG